MSRQNLFSKRSLKSKKRTDSSTAYSSATTSNEKETLPAFEPNKKIFEFPFIQSGEQRIAVFDCEEKIDHRYLSNAEKIGKTFYPWFHSLYTTKRDLAIELTRILLKFLKDQKNNTHIQLAFRLIAEHFYQSNLTKFADIKLKDFDSLANRINSNYARGTTVYVVNIVKKIIELSISASPMLIEKISDYKLTFQTYGAEEVTFEQRVKNAGLTNDYSDYVMFQI